MEIEFHATLLTNYRVPPSVVAYLHPAAADSQTSCASVGGRSNKRVEGVDMFRRGHRVGLLGLCAALTAGLLLPEPRVLAQGLEEIVVTARKREEGLMDVPLAITAMSADTIAKMGITSMNDIAAFTPGFHFVDQVGGGSGRSDRSSSSLVFRGLFLGTANQGQTAGGLLFIDGAAVVGGQPPAFIDMERVEVLKGPQSAYFGRSVLAGAINYVPRDPNTEEWGGNVDVGFGRFDSSLVQASIEGPLFDTLAARFSISREEDGGHYENAAQPGETFGDELTTSAVLQLHWTPTDRLSVKGFFNVLEHDDGPPAQMALKDSQGDFNCNLGGRGGYFCGAIPDSDEISPAIISGWYDLAGSLPIINGVPATNTTFGTSFQQDAGLRRIAFNSSIRAEYSFANGMDFTSLTAYHRDRDMTIIDLNFRDVRNMPPNFAVVPPVIPGNWNLVVQSDFYDYSQEFRLASDADQRLRWSAGFNYLFSRTPGNTVFGRFPFGALSGGLTESESKTPSVFGGIQYDITDRVTVSVDGRFQRDDIRRRLAVDSAGNTTTEPWLDASYNSFSPRISLDWRYQDDSLLYFLYSSGTRPGGFNIILQGASQNIINQFSQFGATIAYDEEQLDNFEIGWKSTWLDGRVQTRLAVYVDPYTEGQNQITIPFTDDNGDLDLASVVVNTGEADLQGFEFEFDAAATDNLTISGTLGYADSELTSFFCGDGLNVYGSPDCNGNQLPSASKWTGTLSAEYLANLTSNYDWFVRGDYAHLGEYFVDYSNVASVPEQDIVNVRAGIRGEKLRVEVFVNNLLEEAAPPSAVIGNDLLTFAASNEIRYGLAKKRTWGVRLGYDF